MQSQTYIVDQKNTDVLQEKLQLSVCVIWGEGEGTKRNVGEETKHPDRFKAHEKYV